MRTNPEFEKYATRRLNRISASRSDAGVNPSRYRKEWRAILDGRIRVLRLVLKDNGFVADVLEVGDPDAARCDPATAYAWGVERCGMDPADASRSTGYDPRRVSPGLSDTVVELADELRALRLHVAGITEEARALGEKDDESLMTEIFEMIQTVLRRTEEVTGV